jgi:TPR repeat protein
MKRSTKSLLATLVVSLSLAAPVLAGPFEDGRAAYNSGDYATALRLWLPLAEQGDAIAQFNLGLLYYWGHGVLQDSVQDYVEAHKWFNLAAARGNLSAADNRDWLAKKMTPDQLAEAQRLAREWKPRNDQDG